MRRVFASWFVDGRGGPLREKVVVSFERGRIADITESAAPGRGPEWLDASGSTLVPPLVDAHVHLFMSSTPDLDARQRQIEAGYDATKPVMREHAAQLLCAGVLAARDGGDFGGYALRFRQEELDGLPLLLKTPGRAFRAPGRYGKLIGRPPAEGQTLAEAISAEEAPIDHVKVVQSGLNSLVTFGKVTRPQFGLTELSGAVARARARGLPVMAHANGPAAVSLALRAGCTSIEHGFFMDRATLEAFAEHGGLWVPTAVTMKGYAETLPTDDPRRVIALRNLEHQLERLAEARSLGVCIAAGTDAGTMGVPHGLALGWELQLFVSAGMSISEAIASSTMMGARLLGLDDDWGALRQGAPASFSVVEGPPETLLPTALVTPSRVFLEGRELSISTSA